MDSLDNEDWQEPVEESEYQPSELYSNTGVACPMCGAIHFMKHHFSNGKFSMLCPTCRRMETNRSAQKKRRVQDAKNEEIARAALHAQYLSTIKMVNTRVNKLMAQAKQQKKHMAAKIVAHGGTMRVYRALARREAQLRYYESVRERMLADATRNQLKPMEHYLQDEELYARYRTEAGTTDKKSTAPKSGAARTDESEGMEERA